MTEPGIDPQQPAEPQQPAQLEPQERTFGMLCHLLAFAGYIGIPFGNIIGPLVMWLIKKDESAFVDYHGKESLNFQISLTIYSLVCIPLCFIIIGIFLLIGLLVFGVVQIILASIKANDGQPYQYPLCIRFIT